MSYESNIQALSRTKVDLIKLKMPLCRHSYGVAPCTASGVVKCYNTFPTCQDRANFNNIGRDFKFINERLPLSVINQIDFALPYIADNGINDLATEIKEQDTVVKRLKVKMLDETDNEVGIDPYVDERTPAGQFWKKFIQRHKNYRGKTIEHWQGFDGLSEDSYQLKFAGVIDNIEYNRSAQIEAVDFLKELSKIKYPLKLDVRCKDDVPNIHEANSQAAMLALEAYTDDYCRRTDFISLSNFGATASSSPIGDLEDTQVYYVRIIAFDEQDRPIHRATRVVTLGVDQNMIACSWTPVAGESYYRIYVNTTASGGPYDYYFEVTGSSFDIVEMPDTPGTAPAFAERYFQLTGDDPSDINDWTELSSINFTINIEGNQISQMPEPGYLRIDKEIIYYASIEIDDGVYYLSGVQRAQFNTEPDWHYQYTVVAILYFITTPTNAFAMMRQLLILAGISEAYISSTFTDYEEGGAGDAVIPDVTLQPIIKDTKLSRLYFDLVRMANCMSWVNEDGLIDILAWDYEPGLWEITDDDIVENSLSVDYNDASRLTRWIIYWNRTDPEEGIDEAKAYSRANVTVDADAEDGDEYGDIKEDVQYCVWLNPDTLGETAVSNYLDWLLSERKNRTRDAQEIIELELELKDDHIKTSHVVKLSTKYLQDIYGNDYDQVKFRVIKKELTGPNKFKLKLLRKL